MECKNIKVSSIHSCPCFNWWPDDLVSVVIPVVHNIYTCIHISSEAMCILGIWPVMLCLQQSVIALIRVGFNQCWWNLVDLFTYLLTYSLTYLLTYLHKDSVRAACVSSCTCWIMWYLYDVICRLEFQCGCLLDQLVHYVCMISHRLMR